jgi:hypothetical protein
MNRLKPGVLAKMPYKVLAAQRKAIINKLPDNAAFFEQQKQAEVESLVPRNGVWLSTPNAIDQAPSGSPSPAYSPLTPRSTSSETTQVDDRILSNTVHRVMPAGFAVLTEAFEMRTKEDAARPAKRIQLATTPAAQTVSEKCTNCAELGIYCDGAKPICFYCRSHKDVCSFDIPKWRPGQFTVDDTEAKRAFMQRVTEEMADMARDDPTSTQLVTTVTAQAKPPTGYLGLNLGLTTNSDLDEKAHLNLKPDTLIPAALHPKPVCDPNGKMPKKPRLLRSSKFLAQTPLFDENGLFTSPFEDRIPAYQTLPVQEENYYNRPSIRISIPDHLKNLLVDDWENVTKTLLLVPLPSQAPANFILDEYFNEEKTNRMLGSVEADILEEFVSGLKVYFEKSVGKILLYRFERSQLAEVCSIWCVEDDRAYT